MAIIENCELWFAKVVPSRPNNKFDQDNPTWECQIRTLGPGNCQYIAEVDSRKAGLDEDEALAAGVAAYDDAGNLAKAQKKRWDEMQLNVKAVVPDEGDVFYRVNLRKKSLRKNKEPAPPVDVVDSALQDVDPDCLGNGSIVNVKVYQRSYTKADGTAATASVLMGIQLRRHILYTPKPRDDDFKSIGITDIVAEKDTEGGDDFAQTSSPKPSTPKVTPEY